MCTIKSVFFLTLRIFKYKITTKTKKKCGDQPSFSKRGIPVSEKLVL
ncbi:MAG: hypothetical protein ACJA17_001058, partial [Polaribacter sp.]